MIRQLIQSFRVSLKKEITRLKLRKRGSFRSSSWISLTLRPWLEGRHITTKLMAPMMAMVVGGAVLIPQEDTITPSWDISQPLTQILDYSQISPTTRTVVVTALPVSQLTGISQAYHPGHPAIDMRAPLNSEVVAVKAGTVSLIEYGSWGYGHRVMVEHEGGLSSLYAHLGVIEAQSGEFVEAGESVGQVGMTGMTTGPHLHFEMYQDGKVINPLPVIATAIEDYQQKWSTVAN